MVPNVSFCFGLMFLCSQMCAVLGSYYVTTHPQGSIETACRDRYFWVSVDVAFAGQVPRFEAVVENGVHVINEDHASMCGYTLKHLNGRATLRASYFSCHTENQNDSHFLFKLNVVLTDDEGKEKKYSLSETCTLPVDWSAKEVLCAENYMEVTVAKDTPCTSDQKPTKHAWLSALALAQRSAISEWQIMFLNGDNIASMVISDARRMGYTVDSTANRVVFRSAYNQPHSTITEIDGIAVEVIRTTVFFRQKWAVVMLDTSAACTIAPSLFNGESLQWRTPKLMTPLVQDPSGFVSKSIELGVEAQLLDEATRQAMGYMLAEDGNVVYVSVLFAAPGGYRRSLVESNVYKESYMVFLCYEHIFSHMFTDGTDMETRHRQLRVLETPLVSRIPFTIDETLPHTEVFTVYLGNFASDVQLIAIKLNENYMEVTDAIEKHYFITKIPLINGTHGIIVKVPFEDQAVNRVYLGEGVLQYSLEINYTLNIIGQDDIFYHPVSVVAQVHDAFPPDITAVCTAQSIVFRMNYPKRVGVWEICVGHQTLTSDFSRLRGYTLKNNSHSMSLEAPLFTSGYIYEDITLRNFVGIFEVLIRDSKTLEIHSRAAKRCVFQTSELTVCSPDGMMTVVATTTKTWPTVPPSSTTLLDRRCRPKSADETRVMFSFGVTTCGTRLMVGDGYIVYENEIVSEGGFVTDHESAITRESKFRLTVRCFYQLTSVNRVFTERLFEGTGFGTLKVIDSTGPQENLISSHTAPVFEPDPWPNKPSRSCPETDKKNTQLLQRGVPHPAYYSPNQGRKTSEHGYHGNNISYQYKRASQLKESGAQTVNDNGPFVTQARWQDFNEGLFKNYKSSVVNDPQKTPVKRSGSLENSVMIGDDNPGYALYKTSKHATSITTESLPSFLRSPVPRSWITSNPTDYTLNNKVSDRLYLREYMDRSTPDSSFPHSQDDINELFNNIPTKETSLENTVAIDNDENNISNKLLASVTDRGQKRLSSYILPSINIGHEHKLDSNASSAQPFKEFGGAKNERLVHQAVKHNNFMHEVDYSEKKLPKHLQWQREDKDGDFLLFEHKPVILQPSSKKLRWMFFPGGSTGLYGPSVHNGILRG